MITEAKNRNDVIKRGVGLALYEATLSNINGNADNGNPRMDTLSYGIATRDSFQRKMRDIVENHDSDVMQYLANKFGLNLDDYCIFESKGRGFNNEDPYQNSKDAIDLVSTNPEEAKRKYWDFRIFGGLVLPENKDKKSGKDPSAKSNRVSFHGSVNVSNGRTISPVDIHNYTTTKKAPLRDKEQDMAPGQGVVCHAIYAFKFYINPNWVKENGATKKDIDLFLTLLPHVYKFNPSRVRSDIETLHVWYAEHENPLGSFSEREFFSNLMPRRKGDDPLTPSSSINDYDIPKISEIKGIRVRDLSEENIG